MASEPASEARAASAASDEARFQARAREALPRNYAALLVHGMLGQTGFRLIHAPTFIPAYVELLSGSAIFVGLVRALQALGMFLSPVLGATLIEHRTRVLPVLLGVGGLMRVQVLGLGLAGLWLTGGPALAAVAVFLTLFGLFIGIQGVAFNFLVAKIIPVERRGSLMGIRNAVGGVVAAGAAFLGGRMVDAEYLGNGYAATFLVAFAFTATGLLTLFFVREPPSPLVMARTGVWERIGQLPELLRSDRGFTFYFVARALGTMGRMSVPLYVIYAGTRMKIGGSELGQLTLAFVLAQSVGNIVWGPLADRRGFRSVFVLALCLWILSALLLMNATTITGLIGVMVGLGAGMGGFMLAAQNLVLEFGAREDLPIRIAVANSASELLGALGMLAGGFLYTFGPPTAVFWLAIGFQAAALGLVVLHVDDPRRREAAP